MKRIHDGLTELLVGADMFETLIVCLSIASTSAILMRMSKLEVQKLLMELYDKRIAEGRHATH